MGRWLLGYGRHVIRSAVKPRHDGQRHLLFAFCDHFEPHWRHPPRDVAQERVRRWRDGYPALAGEFRDADGRPPRHTFFFPGEAYAPEYLEPLAELARVSLAEVELHLHHQARTREELRSEIEVPLRQFANHGHLTRDPDGRLRYAFIHGNWCLANGRRDRRLCGVDDELPLLRETGCYADFTFPAAPDASQARVVNQIYWPMGNLEQRRPYDVGEQARVGEFKADRILMIQGPLSVKLRLRRPFVRIVNDGVYAAHRTLPWRIQTWVDQNIHVRGRSEWVFVKVHTHGAQERLAPALLGAAGRTLHETLTTQYNDGARWSLHYVTAREMYNVAVAAMDGKSGDPRDYFDHLLPPPPAAQPR